VFTCNRKHVVKDLQPYVCIYDPCSTQDILYDSEAAWLKHEQWEHTHQWCCDSPDHPLVMFHMREEHPETFQEHQLQGLADASKRPSLAAFEFCPLCGVTCETLGNPQASGKASIPGSHALAFQATIGTKDERFVTTKALQDLQKHVARHLWQSAVIALPGRDDLDEDKPVSIAVSQNAKSDTFDIFDTPIDGLEPCPFVEEFEEPVELTLSDNELLWERVSSEVLGDRYGEDLGLEKISVFALPLKSIQDKTAMGIATCPPTTSNHPESMTTLTITGLEALLGGLGLKIPIPHFPAADMLNKPRDIGRSYLADILRSIIGCDPITAYNSIQWLNDLFIAADLTVPLPKLSHGADSTALAVDLMQRVRHSLPYIVSSPISLTHSIVPKLPPFLASISRRNPSSDLFQVKYASPFATPLH
jgi:hypothetical protein